MGIIARIWPKRGVLTHEQFRIKKLRAAVTAMTALIEKSQLHNWGNAPPWYRASGDIICKGCGLVYYDHPNHPTLESLTILCDGSLVKL